MPVFMPIDKNTHPGKKYKIKNKYAYIYIYIYI